MKRETKYIEINRIKLERLIKRKFTTLETASKALGFSHDGLGGALRRGSISPKMVDALDRFGIDRRDYAEIKLFEPLNPEEVNYTSETQGAITAQTGADNAIRADYIETDKLPAQMSIDDLERWRRDELKNLIKAAIIELFNVSRFEVDSLGRVTITLSPEALKDLKIEEAII